MREMVVELFSDCSNTIFLLLLSLSMGGVGMVMYVVTVNKVKYEKWLWELIWGCSIITFPITAKS